MQTYIHTYIIGIITILQSNHVVCVNFIHVWQKLQFREFLPEIYIHTYIIGHYNPSVSIIDLASHTTYVVCVNFIHKWQKLRFKVDFERQIFEKLFIVIFFYPQRVFARNLLRGVRRRNILSYFVSMLDRGFELRPFV